MIRWTIGDEVHGELSGSKINHASTMHSGSRRLNVRVPMVSELRPWGLSHPGPEYEYEPL